MWGKRVRTAVVTGAVLTAAALGSPVAQADDAPGCLGDPAASPRTLRISVGGVPTYGLYSLPSGPPKGIVVVGHGYPQTAASVAHVLPGIAQRDGVIALAMDYHGTIDNPDGSSRGWRVLEGAADSIAAARLFAGVCNVGGSITAYGISMGANMTGLAVASRATRPDGRALFDYWFDVAGVTDVPEIYAEATAISLAPIGAIQTTGMTAKADLEQEFGNPRLGLGNYLSGSPAYRAFDMKASGVQGVVIAHGVLDGEVSSDQAAQMALALGLAGIPTDLTTAVFKDPGAPPGLTLDGDVLALIPGYVSPFAGHVQKVVQAAALDKLDDLYVRGIVPTGTRVALRDGELGTIPLLP